MSLRLLIFIFLFFFFFFLFHCLFFFLSYRHKLLSHDAKERKIKSFQVYTINSIDFTHRYNWLRRQSGNSVGFLLLEGGILNFHNLRTDLVLILHRWHERWAVIVRDVFVTPADVHVSETPVEDTIKVTLA